MGIERLFASDSRAEKPSVRPPVRTTRRRHSAETLADTPGRSWVLRELAGRRARAVEETLIADSAHGGARDVRGSVSATRPRRTRAVAGQSRSSRNPKSRCSHAAKSKVETRNDRAWSDRLQISSDSPRLPDTTSSTYRAKVPHGRRVAVASHPRLAGVASDPAPRPGAPKGRNGKPENPRRRGRRGSRLVPSFDVRPANGL